MDDLGRKKGMVENLVKRSLYYVPATMLTNPTWEKMKVNPRLVGQKAGDNFSYTAQMHTVCPPFSQGNLRINLT